MPFSTPIVTDAEYRSVGSVVLIVIAVRRLPPVKFTALVARQT